jgi:hypothetical protein
LKGRIMRICHGIDLFGWDSWWCCFCKPFFWCSWSPDWKVVCGWFVSWRKTW